MSLDLARIGGLERDDTGVWRLREARAHVLSFPEEGHDQCFAVEDDSFWHPHRNACIIAALSRISFEAPLLDIGGGNGAVSAALERAGIETVLVEPGPEGAHNARRRGLGNVINATLEDVAFPDGSFGAAGLFDVIEHLEDDAPVLVEAHRVLRPGGVLAVTVPAHPWLWSAEDEAAGHFRRYTLRTLRATLEAAGFDVRYATYLFAPLTAPVFLLRSLPGRFIKRTKQEVLDGAAAQHTPSALGRRVMEAALAPELRMIRAGRRVPIGTSALAIAVRT